jgi:hypothetical protein
MVLATVALAACDRGGLERKATAAMRRSIPPGVMEPLVSVERDSKGFTARWEFRTDMTPPTYVQWAAHRLAPLFPSRRPDAGGLTLSDALEGDLHLYD